MSDKITSCFLCPCNCGLIMTLDDDGKIIKIRGDKKNPRTKGYICTKGLNYADSIDSPHRLKAPLKREGDRFVEIEWEEAFSGVAKELNRIREEHGPLAISMVLGGSAHPTVQNMFAAMFLKAMGSRALFSPISLEFTSKYLANQKMFGCSYFEGHPDIQNAKFVLMMGTNPINSHPFWVKEIKEIADDPGRTLVVVDPRFTETAKYADIYSPIRPSTDVFLCLAVLNVIISDKLYDTVAVGKYTIGLEEVAKIVERFTPETVSHVTGVKAKVIREIATKFGTEKPGIFHYDMGVIANHHSTLLSWAVKTMTMITGNMGVKGGLLFNPTLINMNKTEKIAFGVTKHRSRIRDFPVITGHLPITVMQDEILTPGPGQIRACIVDGCNPLRSYTNAAKMERAFKELELVVSIDPFLTEVGRLAHYVLPVCSFYEQDNISFAFHQLYRTRHVQLTQKIREPLGKSLPEWKIYAELSKHLGVKFMDNTVFNAGFKAADFFSKIRGKRDGVDRQELLLKMSARMGKTSWKELKTKPHGFDLDNGKSVDMMSEIRTPDKKARLNVPEFLEAVEKLPMEAPKKNSEYPLILSTTARTQANINTMYRNEKWISRHMPENSLIMNKDDAYKADLSEETHVKVSSQVGSVNAALTLTEDVMAGTVYMQGGWGILSRDPNDNSGELRGTAASMLLNDEDGDFFTGMPFLSGVPCRVEKIT